MWLNELYQNLNPIAFSIGPFVVRWYGLAYLFGVIGAGVVMYRVAARWKQRLVLDDLVTLLVSAAFGIIIGGRLGYVLFYGAGYYVAHPLSIFILSEGGMSFHGGLAGAALAVFLACRYLGFSPATVADLAAVGTPVGLLFGRCANFINGELWGKPTDLPWGVVFVPGDVARHPSQLYEAVLEGLVLFVVLYALSRRTKPLPKGSYMGLFLALYGVFRFAVEFVRLPDEQLGYLLGTQWLTMGMVLSIPLVALGAVMVWLALARKVSQQLTR